MTSPTPTGRPGTGTTTFLSFVSQPGDGIARGDSRRFTPENASFAIQTDQTYISIGILESSGTFWRLELAAAPGERLVQGAYAVNEGVSPYFRTGPYISFSGNGLGCQPVGRFTVNAAEYSSANTLSRLHATFEQRCPTSAQGLSGEVSLVDGVSGGATVANIAGSWSGRLESPSGWMPAAVTLEQTGALVTGTWSAPNASWSGSIEGKVALGAFSGSITMTGVYPLFTGGLCEGRAPATAFVSDGLQELALSAGRFTGSCQFMPDNMRLVMWTRQ